MPGEGQELLIASNLGQGGASTNFLRASSVNSFYPALTPELSRTAARNGGVVHVTMQPSREAVSA